MFQRRLRALVVMCALATLSLLISTTRVHAVEAAGPCAICALWYGDWMIDDDGDFIELKECRLQWTPFPGVWCYYG